MKQTEVERKGKRKKQQSGLIKTAEEKQWRNGSQAKWGGGEREGYGGFEIKSGGKEKQKREE